MDGTYFVSRGELIQWVNATFKSSIVKIEDLASGAHYCQIFDECMPGKLQMSKVNWNARQEYEYIANFKILQQGFTKSGIKKNIEVEKLVKGRCQDNLEMLQWMKRFFDTNFSGVVVKDRRVPTPTPRSRVLIERNSTEKTRPRDKSAVEKGRSSEKNQWENGKIQQVSNINKPRVEKEAMVEKVNVVDTNKIVIDTLQKERDFYFEKLREIEIIVQEFTEREHELVRKIQAIIYLEEV